MDASGGVLDQIRGAESAIGRTVSSWRGIEMAIGEGGAGVPPSFEYPDVPCLQLGVLEIVLGDGSLLSADTYQNDDEWGLAFPREAGPLGGEDGASSGTYRFRSLPELPVGACTAVSARLSKRGDLAEVEIVVGGLPVLLVAGETHENMTGELTFVRGDESVLVFTPAGAADDLAWIPPCAP